MSNLIHANKIKQISRSISLVCLPVLILILMAFSALASDYQVVPGPTVLVRAVIKPYISITVNSPVTIYDNAPLIEFVVDHGPELYQALHPLTVKVSSNQPVKVYFEATELTSPEGYVIPPERLSVELRDARPFLPSLPAASNARPGTGRGNGLQNFQLGVKMELLETFAPVELISEWDFQLEITREDRAGTYEGKVFVEVFHRM